MNVPKLVGCARCGGDHYAVTFKKLERPAGDWTHWTSCEKTGEPILLKVSCTLEDRS